MTLRRALPLLLCLFLVASCWGRREPETLGFVLAVGYDWDEEEQLYEVTVQMKRPQAPGEQDVGEGPPQWIYATKGETIFDAVGQIAAVAPRRAWWGHNQIIVLGDALARKGVAAVLDFAARDGETRRLVWMLVTPGKARDIISQQTISEPVGAKVMLAMIRQIGASSTSGTVRLHDFKAMLGQPMAATTGRIVRAEGGRGPSADFSLSGSAVFKEDRLVGYLDSTATRGMLWVKNEVLSGIITVPCPSSPQEKVGLEIVHTRAQIKPTLEKGQVKMKVTIRVESHLGDKVCLRGLSTPDALKKLGKLQEEAVRAELQHALDRARDLEADIFGFGARVQQEMPAVWRRVERDWEERLRELPVAFEINSFIRRIGLQSNTSIPR